MKTFKKIGTCLALAFLSVALAQIIGLSKAAAATPDLNLKWKDGSGTAITGTYNGDSFTLQDSGSGTTSTEPYTLLVQSSKGYICGVGSSKIIVASNSKGSAGQGQVQSFSYKPTPSSSCTSLSDGTQMAIASSSGGPPPAAQINWSGAKGVLSADGETLTVTFSNGQKVDFLDNVPGDSAINFKPQQLDKAATIGNGAVASWCDSTAYSTTGSTDSSKGITLSSYKDTSGTVSVCYNNGGKIVNQPSSGTLSIDIDASAYQANIVSDAADDTSACVANSHTSLEWLLCPITTSVSKAVDGLDKLISSQLNFNVKQNLSDTAEIHTAWSIIKNIASIMIIILMLAMVFSQAIGGTIFDAYTIRKLLPRLIIAVIAMQLSWEICKYLITLANDAGQGIAQLLTAPFGGGGNIDLNSILHRLSPGVWALGSQAIIPALLTGTVIIGFIALPGVMVAAFGLFIGVFTALMMLLFRNVLIVALVIFSPIAFLLWVTPGQGTQKYWKLWSDNFIKLLMLFPLVIAIIYSGRIFAWVVAGSSQGGPNFINYMMILVAYFGPYFIIFKAYKWGGSIYSAGGSAMAKGRQGIVKANSGWITKISERAQGNLADRYAILSRPVREKQSEITKAENALMRAQKNRDSAARLGHTSWLPGLDKNLQDAKDELAQRKAELQPLSRQARGRRAMLRVGAGKPIPSRRQQLETIGRSNEYKKELVDQKHALIHTDYVEQLNSGASVQQAKEYIRDKYGIANYDRVVDSNGNVSYKVKDAYTARAFNNWMVDTKSAMELGEDEWRLGAIKDSKGRIVGYRSDPSITPEMIARGVKPKLDLAKTTDFIGMMNADPQRYSTVAQWFPELQPFNQALGGGPKPTDYLPELRDAAGNIVRPAGKNASQNVVDVDEFKPELRDAAGNIVRPRGKHAHWNQSGSDAEATAIAAEQQEVNAEHLATAGAFAKVFKNLEHPSDIATWRAENFKRMADTLQSLEEAGIKKEDTELYQRMSRQFEELKKASTAGSQEARSTLQRLTGGELSARASINAVLSPNWMESALDLPVTVGGVARIQSLPSETALGDVKVNVDHRTNILTPSSDPRRPNLPMRELAQVIGESADYALAAHNTPQNVYFRDFLEMRNAAARSRNQETIKQVNLLIKTAQDDSLERARRIIREGIAKNLGPAEIQRIEAEESGRSRRRVRALENLLIDEPSDADDPTILSVPHTPTTPTPPPSTIVLPGGPGYTRPTPGDLPKAPGGS